MGGGVILNGQPIEEAQRKGLPVKHVCQALDIARAALANGQMVPPEAAKRRHAF